MDSTFSKFSCRCLSSLGFKQGCRTPNVILVKFLSEPSIALQKAFTMANSPPFGMDPILDTIPILDFFKHHKLPNNKSKAQTHSQKAAPYTILDDKLYQREFNIPLLHCINNKQAIYVLVKIRGKFQKLCWRALSCKKALQQGYY